MFFTDIGLQVCWLSVYYYDISLSASNKQAANNLILCFPTAMSDSHGFWSSQLFGKRRVGNCLGGYWRPRYHRVIITKLQYCKRCYCSCKLTCYAKFVCYCCSFSPANSGFLHNNGIFLQLWFYLVVLFIFATVDSPCLKQNAGCSHLCLTAPTSSRYVCACPVGVLLSTDDKTCAPGNYFTLLILKVTFSLNAKYEILTCWH